MIHPEKFDEFVRQFAGLLPEDVQRTKRDIDKNLKSALTASLARMDLVTREEFDIQSELLARTRALVEELEEKIRQLEAELDRSE